MAMYKCSVCKQSNCRALNHRNSNPTRFPRNNARRSFRSYQSAYSRFNRNSSNVLANVVEPLVSISSNSVKQIVSESFADLKSSILSEVEKRLPPPPPSTAPVANSSQVQLFGVPAITPSAPISTVSALDLANRNILWTKVTSAGVSMPLPLDTRCSVSLVSKYHAEYISKSRPDLVFTKLEQPVPVSVAGPSTDLRAIGTMQVPIVWANGRLTNFTMLVVPNLSWPILFGQNHLRITDARIHSKGLKVHFAEPSLDFNVTCYNASPLASFPGLDPRATTQGSAANVTCLLTPLPSPSSSTFGQRQISLSRGFNLITVCLLITGSLLSSPLFSGPLWLDGKHFSPGLQTLSGPINLQSFQRIAPSGNLLHSILPDTPPSYSKCRPSRPLPPEENMSPTLFISMGDPNSSEHVVPEQIFLTNVLIHSVKGSANLPHNVPLGLIREQTQDDIFAFEKAADYTARNLAESWHSRILSQSPIEFPACSNTLHSMPTDVNTPQSSDILSPFLDQNSSENIIQEKSFPPTQENNLKIHHLSIYAYCLRL